MKKSLPHLVFGGRVPDPRGHDFENLAELDIVGIFPGYQQAYDAWRSASQAHVDDAHMKYVIVHLHRMLDPAED